ncbi:1642_t:CDS:1, partial [Ambispora gerdemannii]
GEAVYGGGTSSSWSYASISSTNSVPFDDREFNGRDCDYSTCKFARKNEAKYQLK